MLGLTLEIIKREKNRKECLLPVDFQSKLSNNVVVPAIDLHYSCVLHNQIIMLGGASYPLYPIKCCLIHRKKENVVSN